MNLLQSVFAVTILLAADADPSAIPAATVTASLWRGKAHVEDGTFEPSMAELKVFLPSPDKANGAAIVICPGGGFIRHVLDRNGYNVVPWLNAHGIAAVLLEYRLPRGRPFVPL